MKLETADLIFQAMREQRDVGKKLVVRTGGFCRHDHAPLYALNMYGALLYGRLSVPTCPKCGLAHHPVNGLGSRDFDGVDDVIDCGSPSTLDNINTFTYLVWGNFDTGGEGGCGQWMGKANVKELGNQDTGAAPNDSFYLAVIRATTNGYAKAAADTVVYGSWGFFGGTYSEADGPRLYKGTPTAAIAEVAYYSRIVGVGASSTEASVNWRLGGHLSGTYTCDGRLAHALVFNRILTVAEMGALQFGRLITNGLIGYWPLWGVASPEADLSGNVNNGTVTGATAANHAPIAPLVVPRLWPGFIVGSDYVNVSDSGAGVDVATVSDTDYVNPTDVGAGADVVSLFDAEFTTVTDVGLAAEFAWHTKGLTRIDTLDLPHVLSIRISDPASVSDRPLGSGLPLRRIVDKPGRVVEIAGWTRTQGDIDALEALADGTVRIFLHPSGDSFAVLVSGFEPSRSVDEYDRRLYRLQLQETRSW